MNIYIDNDFGIAECFFSTKKHYPFIGISVGSPPPSIEKAQKILNWVLLSQATTIPILIADDIVHINYRGLGYSTGKVINQAIAAKEKQVHVWESALNTLHEHNKSRFRLVYWNEIITLSFKNQHDIIRKEFYKKTNLYYAIISLVEVFIKSNGKTVTDKRCIGMAEYVIQELPLLLFGIELDDIKYQMMLYPTHYSSEMLNMIAKIRRKPEFSNLLHELLAINPTKFNKIIQMIVKSRDTTRRI